MLSRGARRLRQAPRKGTMSPEEPMQEASESTGHTEALLFGSDGTKRRLLIPLILLTTLLVLDIAALILVRRSAPTARVEEPISGRPVVVAPTQASVEEAQPATITLDWSSPPQLRWPGAQGLLTSVTVAAGETVENGQVVATVDGVGIIALQSGSPFYRDLARGDKGQDVEELSNSLAGLGLLQADSTGTVMTSEIVDAVRELNYLRGADSRVFSFQHVLWLPEPIRIGEVKLFPGTPAPNAGDTALVGLPGVEGATVRVASDTGEEADLPLDGQARVVLVAGQELPLDQDGRVGDPSVLASYFTPDVTTVDGLQVRLRAERAVYELPASALIVDATTECVAREDGMTVEVDVVGGRQGVVQLAASPGIAIIANPHDAGIRLECQPSS